jgi:hypothetical protein
LSIMVATVKRSAATSAILRRSSSPVAATAATAESMSSTRKPVTPSAISSPIEPLELATTGVPQAIASTTL